MDPEALLDGLDDVQRAIVTSSAMPLVVLAPAGSGKTRVLTRRIAYRVATGSADPRHVLALTFTRKAAGELNDRLGRLGLRGDATTGTFHAVAWATLRTRWADQGRTPLTLLDRKGRLISEVAPSAPGRDKRTVTAGLATEIEWSKARMVTPDSYEEAVRLAGRKPALRADLVAQGYADYEMRKQRGGLVDFDDLLALCARALEEDAEFAAAQRWRFRHLFVDELQDVNPLQFRLLEAWRGESYDVTAVGDPQQAIYGWNGADAGFLLNIHRWWPPAEVLQLEHNYRSTPEILDSAASVLRGARQAAASVLAVRATGAAPVLRGHADDRAEALAIARAVRAAHAPGRPWSDQAVLVRTHGQTHLIAEALRGSAIPHRVRGEAGFTERPEIRRALRHLRGSDAPLGTALADMELQLDGDEASHIELDSQIDDEEARTVALEERTEQRSAVRALIRMGRDYLRLDPSGQGESFSAWLHAIVQREGDPSGQGRDAVDVATFHAAKGLEWAVVHIAGVEEGFVPISHARTAAARAEEARLLYVAMTRAQRDLRITWAQRRTFAARVMDRKRSPLLDPIAERAGGDAATTLPDPGTAPVEEWRDELRRGRQAAAHPTDAVDQLRHALEDWRAATARAARIAPEAVLPDHVLRRVAKAQPHDLAELSAVPGVGTILAGRFGSAMLRSMGALAGSASPS